jgi:hypothetical protein
VRGGITFTDTLSVHVYNRDKDEIFVKLIPISIAFTEKNIEVEIVPETLYLHEGDELLDVEIRSVKYGNIVLPFFGDGYAIPNFDNITDLMSEGAAWKAALCDSSGNTGDEFLAQKNDEG